LRRAKPGEMNELFEIQEDSGFMGDADQGQAVKNK
jgi:hypothetical protein